MEKEYINHYQNRGRAGSQFNQKTNMFRLSFSAYKNSENCSIGSFSSTKKLCTPEMERQYIPAKSSIEKSVHLQSSEHPFLFRQSVMALQDLLFLTPAPPLFQHLKISQVVLGITLLMLTGAINICDHCAVTSQYPN